MKNPEFNEGLRTISSFQHFSDLNEENILACVKNEFVASAKVVAWFNHCVIFGYYSEGKFIWSDPDFSWQENSRQFLEMRIFDATKEFYCVGKSYRFIEDGKGLEGSYVDYSSRLWGERQQNRNTSDNFIVLEDKERQLHLTVPGTELSKYYELVLRAYIGYNSETGQAGYVAYRYLDIVPVEEETNHG